MVILKNHLGSKFYSGTQTDTTCTQILLSRDTLSRVVMVVMEVLMASLTTVAILLKAAFLVTSVGVCLPAALIWSVHLFVELPRAVVPSTLPNLTLPCIKRQSIESSFRRDTWPKKVEMQSWTLKDRRCPMFGSSIPQGPCLCNPQKDEHNQSSDKPGLCDFSNVSISPNLLLLIHR